jgi:hypothetical protein
LRGIGRHKKEQIIRLELDVRDVALKEIGITQVLKIYQIYRDYWLADILW